MSRYFIEAADVLFFKDGREIAPGSEYSASSIFPPNPGTIYGALRSCLLALDENVDFTENDFGEIAEVVSEAVGTKEKKGSLVIEGFSLAQRKGEVVEALYPLPQDVLKRKKPEKENMKAVVLSDLFDVPSVGLKSNAPLSCLNTSWFVHEEGSFFEYNPVFISEKHYHDYLMGDIGSGTNPNSLAGYLLSDEKKSNSKMNQPFVMEPRIGIVVNGNTNTVEEGKLFTTPFIRLNKDVGFILHINTESAMLPDKTKLRLGGDGKLALLSELQLSDEDEFINHLQEKISSSKLFKIILATPAIFTAGWIPDGIDPKSGKGSLNGIEVTLQGANLGKHQIIGGWDLNKKCPKQSRRAVPPGSVYYFKTENPEKVIENLHGKSICADEDDRKQGLGIIHIGVNK